ncbi:MAG: hypothetical protein IPM25_08325 [Chloracidobacterium sp.]|nr:hypothetical protein [Chloracidobacterium sp.]
MFDQESFDNFTSRTVSQSGDLFNNYEIKNWEFSPRVYKILAFSAIFNMAALVFVAQTNLLTLKGCDSPWVGRVCQVLDMAYVGAMLYGTERDYVDVAYDRIELGEADITFIDVTGETPPLSYPEGYFQIANPVQYEMLKQMAENPNASAFTTTTPNIAPVQNDYSDLLKQRAEPPPPNPNAFQDDLATANPPATRSFPGTRKGRSGRISTPSGTESNTNTITTPDNDAVADANTNTAPPQVVNPSDPVGGVDINKRPIVDLGNFVNEQIEKNEVDLQTQFMVNAKGKLTKEGRLDPKTFTYVVAASPDPEMVEVVKRSIEAINVAGYLQYLRDLSGKDLNLVLQQDAENISAVVQSEMESETRANTIKSGLNALISIQKMSKAGKEDDQNVKDDLFLLENVKVETEGKNVVIKWVVPKEIAHPMIQRKLAEQAAEMKKPSGISPVKPENNTAIR